LTNQKAATCHPVIAQSNWSNLVKQSTLVKNWSKDRDVTANIDILDVYAKLDYRIENWLFRKLIQILFGDNL